jgi:hypothetical protein
MEASNSAATAQSTHAIIVIIATACRIAAFDCHPSPSTT